MEESNTQEIKIGNRYYQIHFTSEKSATIYRLNPKTKSINGMGGPLFNCKNNHLSDGWFVFLVRDQAVCKKIWPKVKEFLDSK